MSPEDFRELLVKTVKACGEDIIEHADDLVGEHDHICSFDIRIHFPIDGHRFDGCPTYEITREHCSMKSVDVLMKAFM